MGGSTAPKEHTCEVAVVFIIQKYDFFSKEEL